MVSSSITYDTSDSDFGGNLKTGIMLHNLSQLSIPFFVTGIILLRMPYLDSLYIFVASMIGAYIPDVDHLNMYRTIVHKSFFDFVKIVMRAERYRRAFLVFHNHLTMLILVVMIGVASFFGFNFFISVFLVSFLLHLVLDYLADVMLIKMHSHWKFRNWL